MKVFDSIGKATRSFKRRAQLVVSCLIFIPCAILLMNLETPAIKRTVSDKTAGLRTAPGWSNSESNSEMIAPETKAQSTGIIAEQSTGDSAEHHGPANSKTLPEASAPVESRAAQAASTSEADLALLMSKRLLIPVAGVTANDLCDSFYDARSEGRIHHAIDIRAPGGTPVIATADGKVKLHTSERGGLMIYEIDSSAPYVYYYGHLQQYAEGMRDGEPVKRGEVIGYVGDTGNAGAGNYHLHFGISKMASPGKWSGGEPINPFLLLTGK